MLEKLGILVAINCYLHVDNQGQQYDHDSSSNCPHKLQPACCQYNHCICNDVASMTISEVYPSYMMQLAFWQIITKAVLATCMPVTMQYAATGSSQYAIQLIYGNINACDLHASNSPLPVVGSVIVQGSIYKYV